LSINNRLQPELLCVQWDVKLSLIACNTRLHASTARTVCKEEKRPRPTAKLCATKTLKIESPQQNNQPNSYFNILC